MFVAYLSPRLDIPTRTVAEALGGMQVTWSMQAQQTYYREIFL
jgi:hypothetical protein